MEAIGSSGTSVNTRRAQCVFTGYSVWLYKESNKMHLSYVFILKFVLYMFRMDTPSSGVYVSLYMQLFVHIMLTVTSYNNSNIIILLSTVIIIITTLILKK